jgi:hypothetical protein
MCATVVVRRAARETIVGIASVMRLLRRGSRVIAAGGTSLEIHRLLSYVKRLLPVSTLVCAPASRELPKLASVARPI